MDVAGISLALIGLAFITVAWAYQFATMNKKKAAMNKEFLLLYAVGSLLLAIEGYLSSSLDTAIMNLVAFFIVGMILFKD